MALARAWSGSNSFLRAISDFLVYNQFLDIARFQTVWSGMSGLEHTPLKEFSYENAMDFRFVAASIALLSFVASAGKGTRARRKTRSARVPPKSEA